MIRKRLFWAGLVGIFTIASIGIWQSQPKKKPTGITHKLTIAVLPYSFSSYSVYVALENGIFKNEGLEVTLDSCQDGTASLKAVMDKKADMGASSETPFMRAVLGGGDISACATVLTGERHLAVVARKDRGISMEKDLIGKSIGVTMGSNGEYFLNTVLLLNGISTDQVKIVNFRPDQMCDAINSGKVDAIATWNPIMLKAQQDLGDQGSVFFANGMYSPYFVLFGGNDFIKSNPEIIEKAVRALDKATQFINEQKAESQLIFAKYLKIDKPLFENMTANYKFKVQLEQSFLKTLVYQAKWDIKNKLFDQEKIPNFLDFIYLDALLSVNPENVSIIR